MIFFWQTLVNESDKHRVGNKEKYKAVSEESIKLARAQRHTSESWSDGLHFLFILVLPGDSKYYEVNKQQDADIDDRAVLVIIGIVVH